MKLTFLSNYINHHQIPFCNACYDRLKEDFCFVQAQPMEQERLAMGWHNEADSLPFVKCLYEEEAECRERILSCDVLLAGWSDREDLVQERLGGGKPVIRISERLYREGQWKAVSPRGLIHKYKEHTRYRKGKAYLLCTGAYVPSDFHLIGAYPDKMFRWGYFPETVHYTEEEWEQLKPADGILRIVWAGRFIPLKHAEMMPRLAAFLREHLKEIRKEGIYTDFEIHMAGSGEMEESLKRETEELGVADRMIFHGFLPPEEIRHIMERCQIHVFTSNRLEGWGAVVNEAMNSGCAEVASAAAGAVPYLIRQGVNGIAYPEDDFMQMAQAVLSLACNDGKRKEMGRKAMETITGTWNAEHAAGELLRFSEELLTGEPEGADDGPLSPAPVISERRMYSWMCQ